MVLIPVWGLAVVVALLWWWGVVFDLWIVVASICSRWLSFLGGCLLLIMQFLFFREYFFDLFCV